MIESTVRFDLERERRIGLPEAVFCAGKPMSVLVELFTRFCSPDAPAILFTRLAPEVFAALSPEGTAWNKKREPRASGVCALVSAGNADASVLHEAARTLEYLGYQTRLFEDCGVAGLWRIEANIAAINACDVVILAAGLDAALASVVGGLTAKPLFAVPTSVGYGVAEHGRTALSSMLASCAPGIGVLNIDNGYGAACAAARVLRLLEGR